MAKHTADPKQEMTKVELIFETSFLSEQRMPLQSDDKEPACKKACWHSSGSKNTSGARALNVPQPKKRKPANPEAGSDPRQAALQPIRAGVQRQVVECGKVKDKDGAESRANEATR